MLSRCLIVAATLLCACQRDPARPDLVLVTWDTVRADRVGPRAAGPGEPSPTPTMDRLAAQGVVFEQARSPAPVTLPAHASMLTGLLPSHHGARLNGAYKVHEQAPTLAESLRQQGYSTAAFVSASVLRGRYGLDRGFDHYGDRLLNTEQSDESPYRHGEATLAEALAWLDAQPSRQPVFLWLHLFDAHRPWEPPEPWASRHADPYTAEIARVDGLTGQLLEALEAERRLEHSVVVLTSDHGEGLGEHGEDTHGWFVYDSTVRVPLLFWSGAQRGWRPGSVQAPVDLIDLAPTIAALAGAEDFTADGHSLLPALRGEEPPARSQALEAVMPAHHLGSAPVFGLIEDRQLWVDLPRRERFDLTNDPEQLHNLYQPSDAPHADRLFASHPRDWPPTEDAQIMDEATRSQLAALGYVVPTTAPDLSADSQVDPKDLTALFDLPMDRALALNELAPGERAEMHGLLWGEGLSLPPTARLEALEAAAARHPGMVALGRERARALDALGRHGEASALLEGLGSDDPDLQQEIRGRGASRADAEALLTSIQAHLEAHPDDPDALYDLGVTAARLERSDLAREALARALQERPQDDQARLALARLSWLDDDAAGALALLDERREQPGHDPRLDCLAGRLLGWSLEAPARAAQAMAACEAAGQDLGPADRMLLEPAAP
jgi:choline-sulfatase